MAKRRPGSSEEQLRIQAALAASAVDRVPEGTELAWARAVLQGERSAPPPTVGQDLAAALVHLLVERRLVEALAWLGSLGDRRVSKAARAGSHRLRSQGLAVAVAPPRAARDDAEREPRRDTSTRLSDGILTHYDPQADRFAWIASPTASGVTISHAVLSAERGLTDFSAIPTSRQHYRQSLQSLRSDVAVALVGPEVATWFVYEGAKRSEAAGRELPDAFASAQRRLGPPPEMAHPAEAVLASEADQEALIALYDLPHLAGWHPDAEALQPIALKQLEIATSRLMVDDGQRREQARHALGQDLFDYFDDAHRAAARRYLLDTAHFLAATHRPVDAAHARRAADLFEWPVDRLCASPFVHRFVTRALDTPDSAGDDAADDEDASSPSSSLILS